MNNNNNVSIKTRITVSIPLIIVLFFISLFGLFLASIPIISFVQELNYVETTATIVDAKQEGHSATYYPIYEFEVDGKKVQAEGFPSSSDEIEIGSTDTIHYDPKDYENFNIGSKKGGLIILGIGIMILTGTIPCLVKLIKMLKINIKGK